MDILNFVRNHWIDILAILGALDLILGIVSKWTPWSWDDNVYTLVHNLISRLVKK